MSRLDKPKIIKVYWKPPVREDNRTISIEKFYLRNMPDSKLIGLLICHTKEQIKEVSSGNLADIHSRLRDNRSTMSIRYRNGEITYLGSTTGWVSRLSADGVAVQEIKLNRLYNEFSNMIVNKDTGYDVIHDYLRAYSDWAYGTDTLADYIDNEPLDTMDGYCTKMYVLADSDSYYDGNNIAGQAISLFSYDNTRRGCNDCSYVEYDEDSYDMAWIDDGGGYYVCSGCQDDYVSCDDCSNMYHVDNMNWVESGEAYYCEVCYTPARDGCIRDYNYTPYLTFYDYTKGVMSKVDNYKKYKLPFYGAELEVECMDNEINYYAESIMEYGGSEKYFYCKNDGSLERGFEICFMPMTFNAIKELNLWDAMLKYRGRDKLQSFNTTTCGMHIHINREAFTDHHLFKFIGFIHEFKGFIYLISQRKKAGEFNNFAKFNNNFKDRAKKSMVDSIKHKKNSYKEYKDKYSTHSTTRFGDKYVPVNLQHRDTIEVRIFKGNLLESSIRKNFEFVDSLYYFTRENPIYMLKVKDYLDFCSRDIKKYPNLNSFVESNADKVKDILRFPLEIPAGLDY